MQRNIWEDHNIAYIPIISLTAVFVNIVKQTALYDTLRSVLYSLQPNIMLEDLQEFWIDLSQIHNRRIFKRQCPVSFKYLNIYLYNIYTI